jgi:hypothetical protein
MDQALKQFLDSSTIAEKVKLSPEVVVQRLSLTPAEILGIRKEGRYGPVPEKERICELEVGGQVLALGKIIRRKGETFFKILEKTDSEV